MSEAVTSQSTTSQASRPPAAHLSSQVGPEAASVESSLLDLQQSVGNRAVNNLLNDALTPGDARPATDHVGGRIPAVVFEVLRSSGRGLDSSIRDFMERGFGQNFGDVRIHSDALAARSASTLNALAYTVGSDVAFNTGLYSPGTDEGRSLLAHELAHVVQQRGRTRVDSMLELGSPGSKYEREADRAGTELLAGSYPRLSRVGGMLQMLQRAEYGTYVSKLGPKNYLDAGEQFYKTWGHPNVKRVSTMQDVLTDLAKSKKQFDTFRIVSHGTPSGMDLGMLPEISPEGFGKDQASFSTEDRFRKHFTGMVIVSESFFQDILKVLQKDATTSPMLKTLGADTGVPSVDSALGITLRAIVDERLLEDAQLDTGGSANFANGSELKTFTSLRMKLYGDLVVKAAPKDQQKDVRTAIANLRANVAPAMVAGKKSFGKFTKDEAKEFADPFLEDAVSNKKLKKELKKSIEEGAGGPYLEMLKKVRANIAAATHIEIRGCNVGDSPDLLEAYRNFFGTPGNLPSISAPDLYQYYFQLNTQTYGTHPTEDTRLEGEFNDPLTGVAQGFEDLKRTKAGEMTRIVNEKNLNEVATKYGRKKDDLLRLNPEFKDEFSTKVGDVVWFVQRSEVLAGRYTSLSEFCKDYLGDAKHEKEVADANPSITDPNSLGSTDKIGIPAGLLKGPVASAKPTAADFKAAVRSGQPVAAFNETAGLPMLHLHDPKRADAVAKWLEAQKFDPKGRTAAVLSKLFAGGFEAQRKKTYIQFLSHSYPSVKDPIFPEDPRYDKHIIRKP